MLAAEVTEQQIKGRKIQRKRRDALLPGELRRLRHQRLRQRDDVVGATMIEARRPHEIERHFQRLPPRQGLAPIGFRLIRLNGIQPAPLPDGIVAIVQRQRRQPGLSPLPLRLIQHVQLLQQHRLRPAVKRQVMHQNQAVIHPPTIRLRHPVNGRPDRQFRPQRERPVDILPQPVRPVRRLQRHALQRKRQFTGSGYGALGWHLDNQAV